MAGRTVREGDSPSLPTCLWFDFEAAPRPGLEARVAAAAVVAAIEVNRDVASLIGSGRK